MEKTWVRWGQDSDYTLLPTSECFTGVNMQDQQLTIIICIIYLRCFVKTCFRQQHVVMSCLCLFWLLNVWKRLPLGPLHWAWCKALIIVNNFDLTMHSWYLAKAYFIVVCLHKNDQRFTMLKKNTSDRDNEYKSHTGCGIKQLSKNN